MKNATFRQLRVFSEAARHQSFAEAARALHLTPPAVSMQMKELESQVGLPLFERHGRQVQLTTAGEYVLVYARRILAGLKDAEDAVARLRKLEAGQLTIGMVSTAKYFLPKLLARFREEHPAVDIRLAVGNREQLVRMLHGGEVDIAIMGRPPKELATRTEPFAAHPHGFVAPPDHPLVREGTLAPTQLRDQPFVMREPGSGTRAALEQFLDKHHSSVQPAMEMDSNETIKQAVMAGMGISFLSLHTVGMELRYGLLAVLDVHGAPVVRAWNCVHTLSKLLSPAAEAFRYFVLEQGEGFLAREFGQPIPP
ncbi:MAG: LysR family transcriptional regulator [Proteobacteria bacterium]|jgi:DNA-binding transcriptional LysR family regulator|nr:LysR family transcriptional regulator [Pseudomonadota bacterium]